MSVKVDFSDLKKLQKKLEQKQKEVNKLMYDCAVEIGNEFLQSVIAKTPNSENNELKNAWKLSITAHGNGYTATVSNDVEYASMIEYGHKTAEGGFQQGRYMMTITEQEINQKMEQKLGIKLDKFLNDIFK